MFMICAILAKSMLFLTLILLILVLLTLLLLILLYYGVKQILLNQRYANLYGTIYMNSPTC